MRHPLKRFLVPILLAMGTVAHAQPDSSSGYFHSSDSVKMYYETRGTGFPVVLVHGFTGTGDSWKRSFLYKDLLNAGYQVITIDLRGNGKSDKPHTASAYANDAEAKDIMGLISQLQIKKYYALGYSRGSIITARLLVLDNRLKKGVLGGMGSDFTNPEWPRRIMFYHVLAGDTTVTELESMVKRIEDTGLDRMALALSQKEQPSTSRRELAKVKIPVLVICGSEDSDNGSAGELSTLIPGSIYKTVPGNHGSTSGTQPFSGVVLKFFKK